MMNAITNLALSVATVAFIAGVTFLFLLVSHLLGAPLGPDPVVVVLTVACMVTWRLYRGSTPLDEIKRFLGVDPNASVGLRFNNRWRGP